VIRGLRPEPVPVAAPSGSTVRRPLNLADDRTLTKIEQASKNPQTCAGADREAGGFPDLEIAAKILAG
jgi:hypothetical protein